MKENEQNNGSIILRKGQGRTYNCGTMTAVFKADEEETTAKYSVSEWWLEPNSAGPGLIYTTRTMKYFMSLAESPHFWSAING